jgi:hypothetical protein
VKWGLGVRPWHLHILTTCSCALMQWVYKHSACLLSYGQRGIDKLSVHYPSTPLWYFSGTSKCSLTHLCSAPHFQFAPQRNADIQNWYTHTPQHSKEYVYCTLSEILALKRFIKNERRAICIAFIFCLMYRLQILTQPS